MRDRIFQAWWRVSRGLTLGVRAFVWDDEGRFVLVRHTYRAGWHLPGGGVERAETAETALARELEEEAGVKLAGRPSLLGVFSNHANHPNDHVLVYDVTQWRPCPATSIGEIAEIGWFARDAIPEGCTPGTRRRIAERLDGAPLSPLW